MRLNLTRLRTSGAARRSALRAPSALRAAARRNMLPNMKIEPGEALFRCLVGQREHTTPRAWEREHTLAAHRQHTLSRGSTFSSRLISIFLGGLRSNERGRISGAQHVMTLVRHAGSSAQHVVACRNHAVGFSQAAEWQRKMALLKAHSTWTLQLVSRQVRRLWKGFLRILLRSALGLTATYVHC
jgi:hypothetical protein